MSWSSSFRSSRNTPNLCALEFWQVGFCKGGLVITSWELDFAVTLGSIGSRFRAVFFELRILDREFRVLDAGCPDYVLART